MNAQAIRTTSGNPKVVLAGLFTRRAIWTNRKGVIVPQTTTPAVALPLSSVHWEAYVVDAESNDTLTGYPSLTDTTTFQVADGARPNDEIRSQYMARIRDRVTHEEYTALAEKIASNDWVIAVTVHSTKPV